ncbi:MAG TPA: Sir2 family NAD-dependent protein deacetylase, partial [Chthoniobacterales bacterium]
MSARILVITGAGVSAESGIPTFRGPDGYWRNLDPAKLATPEAFAADPKLVWDWYRERRAKIRSASPNAAHQAIARLANGRLDFLLVTQNVDNLHVRSGVAADRMVQVHGDIFVTRCSRCDFQYREDAGDAQGLPKCPQCGALMRPGVVWFGEQLNPFELRRVESFMERGPCDMVIVAGTTAMFGYIVDWALRATGGRGRLLEVNPEATSFSQLAAESIREPAG